MASPELTVSLNIDELSVLPGRSSIEELLGSSELCRCELLPQVVSRASGLDKSLIGAVAGAPLPTGWEPDPLITMQAVNLFRIQNAYYFPAFGVLIDQQGRAMRASMSQASYLTPDLLGLPHLSRRDGDIIFSPPESLSALPRVLITMPWGGTSNYGHFVIDCLSAVVSLRGIEPLRGCDFVFPPLKAWHRDHLHLLGVQPTELSEGCYYVEDAIFTDCMLEFLHAPNRNLRLIPKIQRAALAVADGAGRKIYLSRRGNPKRRFLSEESLEADLSARGFEIIQAETLPVRDQVALFVDAAVVVGCTGAAFANTVYCNPGTVVLEIQPRTMHQLWVRNICLMMGLKWTPYFCNSREPDQPVVHGGEVRPAVGITFDFDLHEFLAYLDQVTVGRSPGSLGPTHDPGLEASHGMQRPKQDVLGGDQQRAGAPAPAFTILLPVHRPPVLLPYAIRSVQTQARQDFELFVICDGTPPETAECARAFAAKDPRIRVFEHPKGAGNGDVYRHRALAEARGEYVCHIGDDDLWLPNFLTEMVVLLRDVDFGNLSHVEVLTDGILNMVPGDLAVDYVRRRMMNTTNNLFGLTSGGYRLSAYRALSVGWSAAPIGLPSDLHMWRKFLARDDLRFGTRVTVCMLKFAAGRRRDWPLERRREEIAEWAQRMTQPGFIETVTHMALQRFSQMAYDLRLMIENLKAEQASRPDVETLMSELKNARSKLRVKQGQLKALRRKLGALRKTASWRLTRPFRRLVRLIVR